MARELVAAGHGVASHSTGADTARPNGPAPGGYYHFPDYVLDLDELLPQLSDQPVHSRGTLDGRLGVRQCTRRPAQSRLRSLALIEGIGPPEMEPRDPATRLRAWLDGVAKVRNKTRRPMEDDRAVLRRMRVQNPELTDELGLFLASKSTRPVDGGVQWTFDPLHKTWAPRPFQAELFGKLLETITTPTLIVAGERGLRLQDEQERMAKIAHHRFVELPDVGHMIHWFEPQALASELIPFFAAPGP